MSRKAFHKYRAVHNASRDVGLYVVSDDDVLIENVNNVLKRKGIIGVQDVTGTVRYYVDGRHGFETTANQLRNAVTEFKHNSSTNWEEIERRQLYDVIAIDVFSIFGLDFALIGSNILYSIVRDILDDNLSLNDSLKVICAYSEDEFEMSYSQMVRNIRYSLNKSRLSKLRTRAAIRKLALKVRDALNAQLTIRKLQM